MEEKKQNNFEGTLGDVIRLLVDRPDRVRVVPVAGDGITFYDIQVDHRDVGTVIGPKGKHISAIRTIFMAASAVQRQRISITVNSRTD